jgi:hypothetical protein
MEASAVGRVEAFDTKALAGKARIKPAFGAVAMQDIGMQAATDPRKFERRHDVAKAWKPRHAGPGNAKAAARCKLRQCGIGTISTGKTVANDADRVARFALASNEISHMAE